MKIDLEKFQKTIVSYFSGLVSYLGIVKTMENSKSYNQHKVVIDAIAYRASTKVENSVNKGLSPDQPLSATYHSDHAERIKTEEQDSIQSLKL